MAERRALQAQIERLSAVKSENMPERRFGEILADGGTLWESKTAYEQIWEKRGYPELNASFRIWGDTGRVVNLIAPSKTRKVRISFRLTDVEGNRRPARTGFLEQD